MRFALLMLAAAFAASTAHADDLADYREQFGIDPAASFSGVRHMVTNEGQMDFFIRQAPDKMRMEMQTGGMQSVIIVREDRDLNYLLLPGRKLYRQMSISDVQKAGGSMPTFSESRVVGRESVNGHDCTRYRARFEDADGGSGDGDYWVNDDGILVKADMTYRQPGEDDQPIVFEMRDLVVDNQDPSHFEVPDDYSTLGFGAMVNGFGQVGSQSAGNRPAPGHAAPSVVDEAGQAAKDQSKHEIIDETRRKVKEGFGKLFNRDR